MAVSNDVYPSSEDTHLLLDVLQSNRDILADKLRPGAMCIEIGYGYRIYSSLKSSFRRTNRYLVLHLDAKVRLWCGICIRK